MATMAAGLGMFGVDDRSAERERTERRARFDAEAMAQLDALYSFALKLTRAGNGPSRKAGAGKAAKKKSTRAVRPTSLAICWATLARDGGLMSLPGREAMVRAKF